MSGKFIKELEKRIERREKDFNKSFVRLKRNSHLCSRFENEANVLRKSLKAADKQGEKEERKAARNIKK